MMGHVWVGTSGWNYKHWSNGVFYPPELKQTHWLSYYALHFDTVEVNNTFYRLPEKRVFEAWRTASPEGFRFTVKASKFFTHMKKLAEPSEHVARFLENASGMQEKLEVVLFQLPPRWSFNPSRLAGFLEYISCQEIVPKVRVAIEVREKSWYCEACFALLRQHNAALVLADQPGFAAQGPLTANFVFIRRHGPDALYASNYPDEALDRDAQNIRRWIEEARNVYIYFNNDAHGYGVRNALTLKGKLGRIKSADLG